MAHGSTTLPGPLSKLPRPMREFLETETAGGIVLVVATIAALVWVNAPFGESYEGVWNTGIDAPGSRLDLDLRHWINDGLMAIFFFVAGLEIKRELVKGELGDRRRASLPIAAALGGMIAPAALYVMFNAGGAGADGWGIPMATDIAFAIGLLSLFGDRISQSLRIFLLSLAIVDDIGAILVIAFFYTASLSLGWLAVAVVLLAATLLLRSRRVVSSAVYLVLGVLVWFCTFQSGIHATIAGVALGLATPARPFDPAARRTAEEEDDYATSPADRLIHHVHPYSSFLVVPLFALANAGIPLNASVVADAVTSPVALGILVGLVVGKLVGIMLFSWLAVRFRIGELPEGATWPRLAGVAAIAGVGFTVSLFIAGLAFTGPLYDVARVGVLAGSVTAAIAGSALLSASLRRSEAT